MAEAGNGRPRVGGRYELGELLGRGGMAEVRRGTDVRLGRTVAVKRLRTDLAADPTFQARFRREAQSAAGLNHPNIVSVYDTGEEMAPDGSHVQPYIVMEYVAGRTLREVLNDGRKVLPERALEIAVEVLGALDYSHRAGIIHRDIKPANVMLTPSGDVKVMDFGIARAISDGTSTMTQTQAVVGTAQYLSPEQARGESVDSRSDVYSAGCLLYELLTGRPPFVGDSPFSVAYQHVRENPQPPSAYNPELTPQIDAILMKALAKRVEERYQSAAEMQADIQRYLDGHPVDAPTRTVAPPPVPAGEPTSIFAAASDVDPEPERQSKRWPLVLLVVVVVALVVGGIAWGTQLFTEEDPDPSTVPQVTNMTVEAAEARLEAEGLALGDVTRENSDDVPVDRIISQSPEAQESVEAGSEVDVVVSAGEETVVVPFLLNMSVEEAQAALADRSLESTVRERDSEAPAGQVLETDPQASQTVPVGSTVTLFVSSGPVEVPNVVGLSENDARQRLQDANLKARVEYDDTTPAERGLVLDQDPEGLEEVAPGSTVTITVSRYEEPTPTQEPTPTTDPTPPEQPGGGGGGDAPAGDETPGAVDGAVDPPSDEPAGEPPGVEAGRDGEVPQDGTAAG